MDGPVRPHPSRPRLAGLTEVRVLAGPTALVFGFRCHDPEPSGIVSFTKERDGNLESEDHVAIVLDPFQDGRSGHVFAVNPGGGLRRARLRGGEWAFNFQQRVQRLQETSRWASAKRDWEVTQTSDGRWGILGSGLRAQWPQATTVG